MVGRLATSRIGVGRAATCQSTVTIRHSHLFLRLTMVWATGGFSSLPRHGCRRHSRAGSVPLHRRCPQQFTISPPTSTPSWLIQDSRKFFGAGTVLPTTKVARRHLFPRLQTNVVLGMGPSTALLLFGTAGSPSHNLSRFGLARFGPSGLKKLPLSHDFCQGQAAEIEERSEFPISWSFCFARRSCHPCRIDPACVDCVHGCHCTAWRQRITVVVLPLFVAFRFWRKLCLGLLARGNANLPRRIFTWRSWFQDGIPKWPRYHGCPRRRTLCDWLGVIFDRTVPLICGSSTIVDRHCPGRHACIGVECQPDTAR